MNVSFTKNINGGFAGFAIGLSFVIIHVVTIKLNVRFSESDKKHRTGGFCRW